MWLLFLLPLVVTETHIWDQIRNHLDFNIDPCDDFYEHVCSESLMKNLPATNWQNTIADNFKTNMPIDYARLLNKLGKDNEKKLEPLAITVAYANYIKKNQEQHTEAMAIVRYFVQQLKTNMEKSVQESKSLKQKNMTGLLIEKIRSIELLEITDDPIYYSAYSSVEKRFDSCMSKKNDSGAQTLCGGLAITEVLEQLPSAIRSILRKIFIRPDNAVYLDNQIYLSPHYYRPYPEDVFTTISTTGFTVAHEIGHTVFEHDEAHKKCLPQTMKNSCQLFGEEFKCLSGPNTREEDAADWIAYRLMLDFVDLFLNGHGPVVDLPSANNMTNYQLYFYAQAADWCETKVDQKDNSKHSMSFIRVNGQFRQFKEFQEAFGCKQGDRMVVSKNEKCLLAGVNSLA